MDIGVQKIQFSLQKKHGYWRTGPNPRLTFLFLEWAAILCDSFFMSLGTNSLVLYLRSRIQMALVRRIFWERDGWIYLRIYRHAEP